jgi:hypothetical protein
MGLRAVFLLSFCLFLGSSRQEVKLKKFSFPIFSKLFDSFSSSQRSNAAAELRHAKRKWPAMSQWPLNLLQFWMPAANSTGSCDHLWVFDNFYFIFHILCSFKAWHICLASKVWRNWVPKDSWLEENWLLLDCGETWLISYVQNVFKMVQRIVCRDRSFLPIYSQ